MLRCFTSINPTNNRAELSTSTIFLFLCLQFWILGIRLGRFQGKRILLVTVRSSEMRPMNICEFCLCLCLLSLHLQHPPTFPGKQHTLGLFQSFLASLLGNISFLEQQTPWGRPWEYINLQELHDWNSWAALSSKYKFILTLKSQSATECFPCPSFALSFCAYVCVSVGGNQWELRLSGMQGKLEKRCVGNVGTWSEGVNGRWLSGTKGVAPLKESVPLHAAHWRGEDVVSWCLARKICRANWETLVSLDKDCPHNRSQKNLSLFLVLRSRWTPHCFLAAGELV